MGNSNTVAFADRELATAAEKGNLPRVKFLVEKDGANVNFQDSYGWSAVLHAISEGQLDVIKYLLSKGATTTHLTADRANAIHHAVTSQNDSVLQFILQYGTCDINGQNDGGWTPLHLACLSNQYNIVKLLLSFKASTTIQNNEGKLPAEVSTSVAVRTLLERGLSPRGEAADEITEEEELHRNKGMQQSLQRLQSLQTQPKAPVEMKGYTYLTDQPDSSEDLESIATSSNYNTNATNNENTSNNNNNNASILNTNNNNNNTRNKPISGEGLLEREYKRIFDSIHVLRGIDPDNLTLVQVQELIDFHHSEMQKYLEAKKIMEEIRAKELDLLLAE